MSFAKRIYINYMTTNASTEGPHPVDRHVGQRVAALRLEKSYSQSDLARALGLTFQQVQKYEKGVNRISASKLWDISRFLAVDIAYFFEGLGGTVSATLEDGTRELPTTGPLTRYAVEIGKLAPRLKPEQQRLALDLVKALSADE